MGQNSSSVGEKELDELKFFGSKANGFASNFHEVLLRINPKISGFKRRLCGGRWSGASQQSSNAGGKFGHAEWFAKIVVGAEI